MCVFYANAQGSCGHPMSERRVFELGLGWCEEAEDRDRPCSALFRTEDVYVDTRRCDACHDFFVTQLESEVYLECRRLSRVVEQTRAGNIVENFKVSFASAASAIIEDLEVRGDYPRCRRLINNLFLQQERVAAKLEQEGRPRQSDGGASSR